jgi:ABC-type glycerol-3-phosphate transport system substrate-binding protein
MRWLTIVLVLALALGGTACGGGDEATGDTTTVATETTTDETTTDETMTDTVPDFSGLASDDCLALVTAIATLGTAFVAPVSGDTADTSEFFDRFDAPEEIRADFETLAEAYAAYGAALQDIGLAAGQTPSAEQLQQYQQALASIDQPGVAEASERISAWTEQNCSSG